MIDSLISFQTKNKMQRAHSGPARGLRYRGAKRSGATLVEFAMVMPILLLLTLGMIQGGLILNARISLSSVIRDVGRYAAINGTAMGADASIKDYAVQKAKAFNLTIKPADVTLGPPDQNTAAAPKNRVQYTTQLPITIRCDISGRVFLPTTFFGAKMLPGGVVVVDTKVMCE